MLKNIVTQNVSSSIETVFVYADKSIRVSLHYFIELTYLRNSTYRHMSDSQTSFPVTNWTGLAEISQS